MLQLTPPSCIVFTKYYIKLYDPLDEEVNVDFKCWIVQELKPSYIDKVAITPQVIQKQYKTGNYAEVWFKTASIFVSDAAISNQKYFTKND